MGYSTGFAFKQFYVQHDRCAMKVGTDGVLLGAWCPIDPCVPGRILDIGTGCGLIALMLAQRTKAYIEAIDIDPQAVEQANANFCTSPWRERLQAYQSSAQAWETCHLYDLVVSNPPYFRNSLKNPDKGREQARHTDSLSYEELIAHSVRLLKPCGQLAVILPADAETDICHLAMVAGMHLTHKTLVYSKEGKPARRVLLCWTIDTPNAPIEDALVLEDVAGGRSASYQELTQDFYL